MVELVIGVDEGYTRESVVPLFIGYIRLGVEQVCK